MIFERIINENSINKKTMRMKELNKDENLSIIGGYYPPSEEQLKNLNPIERIFICC